MPAMLLVRGFALDFSLQLLPRLQNWSGLEILTLLALYQMERAGL